MKTETQIAEENIKIYKASGEIITILVEVLEEHKVTCQRFLGFLEVIRESNERAIKQLKEDGAIVTEGFKLTDKITDLKQAIKLYEDAGI